MSKVIAVIDKPKNCQECVFGACKFSHPFWSREKPNTKGYYCQLLPPDKRNVQEFTYDGEVHLDNCPLVPMPEKMNICGIYNAEYYAKGGKPPSYKVGWNDCVKALGGKEE